MPPDVRYHDFTLRLQPDGWGGVTVLVQHAPAGGGSAPFQPPFAADDLDRWVHTLERQVGDRGGVRSAHPRRRQAR